MRSIIAAIPPITSFELFCAYVFGAMVRGLAVGLGVWLITFPVCRLPPPRCHSIRFLGDWLRRRRQCHPWHAGPDRRHLVGEVRSPRGVSKLHHHAAHVPERRLLSIHSLPAFWQTSRISTRFLHDRRLPLRLLFGIADVSPLAQSWPWSHSLSSRSRPSRSGCWRRATN